MPITKSPSPSPNCNLPFNESDAPSISASSSNPMPLTTPGEMQSPRAKLSKGEIANVNFKTWQLWQVGSPLHLMFAMPSY